jgi:hypothetical protein
VRFQRSIRVSIEHGHANRRSDDYSSTAYWYQNEPHAPFALLPVEERLPRKDLPELPSTLRDDMLEVLREQFSDAQIEAALGQGTAEPGAL